MSLPDGIRLGSYEILSALGAGGMGEVYRARDKQLDRDVAIKLLPAAFANDADSVGKVSTRSEGPRLAEPSAYRRHLRTRGRPRRPGHRDGARRGRGSGAAVDARCHSSRRGAADRAADRGGAGGGTRASGHPPRPEAREYQSATRRLGEGAGLRACEGSRASRGNRRGRRLHQRSPARPSHRWASFSARLPI